MEESLFYSHVKENPLNKSLIDSFKMISSNNKNMQFYLITAPLGEKYHYSYEDNVVVVLSPKHKIIFLDLKNDEKEFAEYYDDFIEDLSSISDKYKYKEHIGRPRNWKANFTVTVKYSSTLNLDNLLYESELKSKDYRVCELLISLLIGSINDVAKIGVIEPELILDKVKQNIILFDGDQTRFIYQEFTNKIVSIQGLSGTGKTELLLHKLKEIYLKDVNSKIFFTCHNIALANTLKTRIPEFFNFMKVEKQIEWNSRLWVNRAWGSKRDVNSGLYSYISDFYNFPFLSYSSSINYNYIYSKAFEYIVNIPVEEFEFAFDYILIDERQDFPEIFFKLCEKITRKRVYIAGDIFQDIFENSSKSNPEVDIVLNKCYRTDPRTLMFAHSIGLGLFESKKFNWFDDSYWEAIGYKIKRNDDREFILSREPIRRFEDLHTEEFHSTIIENSTNYVTVLKILNNIKENHPSVRPDDIAIIILDENNDEVYRYIDMLCFYITDKLKWNVNRAIETKSKVKDALYITNPNNVKGLEFPFVLCVTYSIKKSYKYRNILYTMLTRSFIQSYLLVAKNDGLHELITGLDVINTENVIKTIEPLQSEKDEIINNISSFQKNTNISYQDFLVQIFDELKIEPKYRENIVRGLMLAQIEEFDREMTIRYITVTKEFFCI